MSFKFRCLKTWVFGDQPTFHAIGVIEEGTILPPVAASVVDAAGHTVGTVTVESVALTGGRTATGQDNELTLVVRSSSLDAKQLEGCQLSAS